MFPSILVWYLYLVWFNLYNTMMLAGLERTDQLFSQQILIDTNQLTLYRPSYRAYRLKQCADSPGDSRWLTVSREVTFPPFPSSTLLRLLPECNWKRWLFCCFVWNWFSKNVFLLISLEVEVDVYLFTY